MKGDVQRRVTEVRAGSLASSFLLACWRPYCSPPTAAPVHSTLPIVRYILEWLRKKWRAHVAVYAQVCRFFTYSQVVRQDHDDPATSAGACSIIRRKERRLNKIGQVRTKMRRE